MSDTSQKIDDKKGDEVLARLLKTPPKPKDEKPNEKSNSKNNS